MKLSCPKCKCEIELAIISSGAKAAPSAPSSDLDELMSQIDDSTLTKPFEREFMSKLRERYEKYGAGTMVSEKQMAVLRRIAAGGDESPW